MKKIMVMVTVFTISMSLAACAAPKEEMSSAPEMTEEKVMEPVENESTETVSIEETEESNTSTENSFEDNFTVDSKTAMDFGMKIKEAVAGKDIEKLAELVSFPTYVGFDEGFVVDTKEDFISLDKEKLFTDEMLTSIEGADVNSLTASKAGFTLQTEGSKASITYSVVEGKLGIVGINY